MFRAIMPGFKQTQSRWASASARAYGFGCAGHKETSYEITADIGFFSSDREHAGSADLSRNDSGHSHRFDGRGGRRGEGDSTQPRYGADAYDADQRGRELQHPRAADWNVY